MFGQQKKEVNPQSVIRYNGKKIETIKDIEKFTKIKVSYILNCEYHSIEKPRISTGLR